MSSLILGRMKNRNKVIFGLPLILVMVSLACALPFTGNSNPPDGQATQTASSTPPPEPTPTQRILPPALVEIDPPPGVELALDGAIRLYFNQPMDQASVEGAFESDAIPSAEFNWPDDTTLTIRSAEKFTPSANLAFEIGTSARSVQGQNLIETISLGYKTVSPLKLIQKLPEQGSQQVNPASAIVAAFNQPVVPLGADQADLPAAFSLEPAAGGRGEWINTSTYIFYPQPGLSGGATYRVTVDPQLETSTGAALENSESWQFSTALPRVERVMPALGSPAIDLDGTIVLTFNQAMDPASVEANFRLEDPAGNSIPGSFTWTAEKNEFTWQPANMLARDTLYNLRMEAGARSQGGAPLATEYQANILSIPELRVVSSKPAPGGQVDPYSGLSLRLSGPIEPKNLSEVIRFEPQVSGVSTYWDQTERALYINGYFEPSTDYRLVISPALKDPWGSSIGGASGADYTLDFQTLPLQPSVWIGAGYGPQFLTGQDRAVAAQVSGFASLPLSVGSVPVMDFLRMQGQNGYEIWRNYLPADERTWKQAIEGNPDRTQETEIFLSPEQTTLPTGIYMLAVDTSLDAKSIQKILIIVSNIHLTLKVSATDALAWAVDLQSGNPLAGTPITLYTADGAVLASGITDKQGLFYSTIPDRANIYEAITALIGQPGEDLFAAALSTWDQDINPWSFDLPTDYQGPRTRAYLYSDRPIYRPGQTVYFRGIVRQAYNGRYEIPALNEVKVQFFDDQGQEVNTLNLPLSKYGTFHSQLELPSNLRPGSYSLSIPDLGYNYLSIPVADYRKPEINLQTAFDTAEVTAGEKLQAVVKARYFFDAPAGNVPVNWTLTVQRATFDLPGYSVGLHGAETWYSNPGWVDPQVASGVGITAPDGTLRLDLGPAEAGVARQELTLEVTAEDESGLPVSTRTKVLVNPSDIFIGLRSEQWTGRADEPFGFEVKTVRSDQSPAGGISLRAEFSQVSWVLDSSKPNNTFTGPSYRPEYSPVASTDFLTGPDGLARLEFTPPDPGIYQLDVFSLPDNGPETRTEIIAWVGGAGQFTFPTLDNRHIELTADQTGYQPGDKAQVFIPNPFPTSVQALVSIERAKILRYSIQVLEPGGSAFNIPLTDEDAPNVYVSVTLLGLDGQGQVDFRQGYINLPVEPHAQTLNVQVTSQPEVAGPGETVEFEVLVTDSQGTPVQGEFSLAVVDLAALALADPNSQGIVPAFYNTQPIGVRTGIPLAVYAARKVEQIFGGGGGGDGSGVQTIRERFPDTAFWQADLITDAAGKARVSLVLPDNLTTWWVETRGLTADTRVGQASTEIVATKELLVRPVTPRFLVAGDRVELAAVVQNNTSQEISGEATLLAEGVSLEDPSAARQKFSMPANGRIRFNWWVHVEDQETARLTFSAAAQDGTLQDAARPVWGDLPILSYSAPQTFRTAGYLDQGGERTELVSLPRFYDPEAQPDSGSLSLELAPSLAATMIRALDVLEENECPCIDLTVSRFLPNLELYRVFKQFGLQSTDLETRLERNLDIGIQTLLNRQNVDGGWGWWPGDQSDPFITSYILWGLARASEAGVLAVESPVQRAVEYLNINLAALNEQQETWELDRLAFAYYSLSQAGSGSPTAMLALYQKSAQLSPWAQALLALAIEQTTPGSPEARSLIRDLQSQAVRSAAGAHWERRDDHGANMASTLTNSAIVTYALAQRDPGAPLTAEAVRYLVANRQADGAWTSSYTTAWTLIALTEVMKATSELGGDFSFGAIINEAPLANGQASGIEQLTPVTAWLPLKQLYPDSPNQLVIERSEGTGRLYYSAILDVSRPAEQAAPLAQGMYLSRQYFPAVLDCARENCTPIQSAQTSEKVTVRLTLSLSQDGYYVMVEDFIPAGAEILDTRLKTSQQTLDGAPGVAAQIAPNNPYANGWGWWIFNEASIFDDHIAWSAEYLPAGVYELTYTFVPVQAGEYQVLPAHAWELYFPEVQATSSGARFVIK